MSLEQQISQKTGAVDRVSNMISNSRDEYFTDWKDKSTAAFSTKVAEYGAGLQAETQKRIADLTEGTSVIADSPIVYSMGKSAYSVLPENFTKGFDNAVFKKYAEIRPKQAQKMVNTAKQEKADEDVRRSNLAEETGAEEASEAVEQNPVFRTNLLDMEDAGIQYKGLTANQLLAQDVADEAANTATETAAATSSAVGAEAATAATGAEVATGLESADIALASTGIGAPVAGAALALGAIGYGIYDIFHHHKKEPELPKSVAPLPAMSSRYNISANIIPTTSSIQTATSSYGF